MTKERIAITGGRGRLAMLAASFFRKLGHEVVLFSRQGDEKFHSLQELLDPAVMASFNTLFHCAWSTVPFISEQDKGREEREDLPLLEQLLNTLIASKQQGAFPKFIFISSAAVYGNQEKKPAHELIECYPLSRYATAKLKAEKMILEAEKKKDDLNIVILRVTNVIGFSSDPTKPQGVLSKMIAAAKQGETLEIWGDGCCSKDYLWIDDFLSALNLAMTYPVRGIFNIGSAHNFSLLELKSIVEEVTQFPIKVKHQERYAWDVSKCLVDSSAFSQATGWQPCINIRSEIKKLTSQNNATTTH